MACREAHKAASMPCKTRERRNGSDIPSSSELGDNVEITSADPQTPALNGGSSTVTVSTVLDDSKISDDFKLETRDLTVVVYTIPSDFGCRRLPLISSVNIIK